MPQVQKFKSLEEADKAHRHFNPDREYYESLKHYSTREGEAKEAEASKGR